jgi:hypothetical protein
MDVQGVSSDTRFVILSSALRVTCVGQSLTLFTNSSTQSSKMKISGWYGGEMDHTLK